MATLPDHLSLILIITAAVVYLWMAVLNPIVFAVAPSHVSAPVSMAVDQGRPATTDIEAAPFWD